MCVGDGLGRRRCVSDVRPVGSEEVCQVKRMTREVHPLSCTDRRSTCLGQAGRVESGSWERGEKRERVGDSRAQVVI